MKLAIISDTHDNLANLGKFLFLAEETGVKILLHCGDVCRAETLKKIAENFNGKIYIVLGNADIKEGILKVKKRGLKIFPELGEVKIGKLRIAFSHFETVAKKLCRNGKYDFVFYGGDHKPWLEEISGCILANPGNLAGLYYEATFAVLDTKKKNLELKILEKL